MQLCLHRSSNKRETMNSVYRRLLSSNWVSNNDYWKCGIGGWEVARRGRDYFLIHVRVISVSVRAEEHAVGLSQIFLVAQLSFSR